MPTSFSILNAVEKNQLASGNAFLMREVLRDEWGFEGLVMSDWFGGQDAVAMVMAGNDLLEPGTNLQWKALKKGHKEGTLSDEAIDTSVRRILKLIFESKKMQNYSIGENPDLKAHAKVTRESATEGMVLLKNEGALPMERDIQVALMGTTSYNFIAGGTGSGDVNEAYTVSLEEGMKNAGYQINSSGTDFYEAHKNANAEAFVKKEGFDAMMDPSTPPEMTYTQSQLEQLAQEADLGILTIGRNSGEGGDRKEQDDFLLTALERDNLQMACDAFHKQDKKLIVVLNVGGVIETDSWKNLPDAILLAWQGGQEGGNAVADILTGVANPSGKLPMTFPVQVSDHASHANFPLEGKPIDFLGTMLQDGQKPKEEQIENEDYTNYEEGIYVGYRHFDKAKLPVSYPFGFGLSYTGFELSDPVVTAENDSITVMVTVKNIGEVAGKEVIQVYAAKPETTIDRPEQELKAFHKTKNLEPGETETLSLSFPVSDLRYWDETSSGWKLETGSYTIKVGTSSRDIKLSESVEI